MGYIGKDIIHYGCGLELDPEIARKKISHAARKNIKKGGQFDVDIKRVKGDKSDLELLRNIWYEPNDPNFPVQLNERDLMYLAYENGECIGGTILVPVGSHLFLNNLAANARGKEVQLQSLLLWHVVEDLHSSQYKYIDVGVSYRPNLYRFFKSWSTFNYPVIFNPPEILPKIGFLPFKSMGEVHTSKLDFEAIQNFTNGMEYTIVPNLDWAIKIVEKLNSNYEISVYPNKNSNCDVQIIDIPKLLPTQYGGLLVGIKLSEKELWNDHGCFDFVKTGYLEGVLSQPENHYKKILDTREKVFSCYSEFFEIEDIKLDASETQFSSVRLSLPDNSSTNRSILERFAKACHRFGIDCYKGENHLDLPCHQNISSADIEYIYGVYRGVLNLCSEWAPTNVKGQLKD